MKDDANPYCLYTHKRLEEYRKVQGSDPVCKLIMQYLTEGWPDKKSIPAAVAPFWKDRNYLSVGNNLLMYGQRIVIPQSLRSSTLEKIHSGHQGMERCKARAATAVWWPGINKEIVNKVQQCPECAKNQVPAKEPLISTPLPDYPWQMAGVDLFELKQQAIPLTSGLLFQIS